MPSSLQPGVKLGRYEIRSRIGAGGMGEVYRARDPEIGRDVAIKVLPPAFAADADRLRRFEQEARAAGTLNHPNILAIYDIGSRDGAPYVVAELLEGETLRDEIHRGALPRRKALDYARQIAEGLAAAHDRGVVHRDLKPENLFVTRDGRLKILDFGLAKLLPPGRVAADAVRADLPTVTRIDETATGMLLGTVGYMAPEQARGESVDHRADVFAFGAVLYEMLTGRRAFQRGSTVETLGAILQDEPPELTEGNPRIGPALERVLRHCLEKRPEARFQSARDLAFALDSLSVSSVEIPPSPGWPRTWTARPRLGAIGVPFRAAVAVGLVLLLLVAVVGVVAWKFLDAPAAESRVVRLTLTLPAGEEIAPGAECSAVAVSPAGTHVAYTATSGGRAQLYVRAIDSLEATPLAGTEAARCPFFSPDGQWIGFLAERKLKKVSVASGITQTLCDATDRDDATWAPDGSIYFAATTGAGLSKVSADGGSPTEVTTLDRGKGEVRHRWPHVLPGGKAVMFTVWTGGPGWDEGHVYVQRLDTGERTAVVQGNGGGRYVASGHLVYQRHFELFAVPFDLDRLRLSGPAVRLANGVGLDHGVSDLGDLVYRPVNPQQYQRRLVWVGRDGGVEPLVAPEREYRNVALSADGRFAVVDVWGGAFSLWIYDFARTTLTPFQTGAGSSQAPRFTPDGNRIVYRGTRAGLRSLWWKTVDGTTDEERLTTGEWVETPGAWSADGEWLVYTTIDPVTGVDVWALRAGGDRKPHAVVSTTFNEFDPRFSPDGRWLAYTSDEPGRLEVFVQPFAGPGARSQISTDGGTEPVWSPDGRELFYVDGDRMMAVEISTEPTFRAGAPRLLFEGRYALNTNGVAGYDVSSDGQRFLRLQPIHADPPANQIHVVLNWFEELRRRVPVT